jgi:MoaA/NifB/PqqE/SkfB family radical SAM enzyme
MSVVPLASRRGHDAPFNPVAISPQTLYLAMSTSNICNYRCKHCHIWMREDRRDLLPLSRRLEVVDEFADMSPQGLVVVHGGEVTLDPEQLYAIAARCRSRSLPCLIVTNGSRIQTPEAAARLASSGISIVSVSLDSHRPELHEYTRGVRGGFDDTVRAIRLLAEARDRGAPLRLIVACVVFDRNVEELDDYFSFVRGLGADHMDFQMLARTFANSHPDRDVFFERHFWHDPAAKHRAIGALRQFVESHEDGTGFLVKRPGDLDWIEAYIEDPDFTTADPVCGSHHQNLIVDTEGNAALCFNTTAILSDPFAGNVAHLGLREIWRGLKAGEDRKTMDVCRLNCGALNCHRDRSQDANH